MSENFLKDLLVFKKKKFHIKNFSRGGPDPLELLPGYAPAKDSFGYYVTLKEKGGNFVICSRNLLRVGREGSKMSIMCVISE